MADLPAQKIPPQSTISSYQFEASFSGPTPPPAMLHAFDEVCPGAADRILAMAEDDARHRRELEIIVAKAAVEEMRRDFAEARLGQVCALVVSVLVIAGGVSVVLMGHEWGNLVTASGLATLVGRFISGRRKPKEIENLSVAKAKTKRGRTKGAKA